MASRELNQIVGSGRSTELAALEGNLLSAAKGRAVKSIFFTSCLKGEGKTTASVKVSHALATVGNGRVLLVDANSSAPRIGKVFGLHSGPGLAEFLLSRAEENDVIQQTEFNRFSVMGFGAGDGGSAAMESDVFAGKLKSLMARFDYVVFDGDSLLTSSNASMIVKHFDGVVLVVECERTKWEVLRLAREKVQNVGGNVLGVVLNKRRYYIPRGLYGKI